VEKEGLIIFIKNPEKGKVKTRLAAEVGEEKALQIYRSLLRKVRKLSGDYPVRRFLFYSRFIDRQDEWTEDLFQKHLQEGAGLGERMHNAFEIAFQQVERAVIIGSDCPELSSDHLDEAFQALRDKEVAIGPAQDGGYYLLGLKTPSPFLFEKMTWSTSQVFRETMERIKNRKKTVHVLPALSDIDYASDWEEYRRRLL
jgi:rSAM/selenodomain-associated transferase 1